MSLCPAWVIQQDLVTRKKGKGGEEDEEGGRISLGDSRWPGVHHVCQAGLELAVIILFLPLC